MKKEKRTHVYILGKDWWGFEIAISNQMDRSRFRKMFCFRVPLFEVWIKFWKR